METRLHAQVKTAPVTFLAAMRRDVLQRKCGCGSSADRSGECEGCNDKKLSLQRSIGNLEGRTRNAELETRNPAVVPPIVHEVLRSSGQPLDANTRAFMEPRFGHNFGQIAVHHGLQASGDELQIGPEGDQYERQADDIAKEVMGIANPASVYATRAHRGFDFSRVRIHTDTQAADSARAVNAVAYTIGDDVVFGAGQYAPQTSQGRRLLAHELAHVVQQTTPSSPSLRMQRQQPAQQTTRVALTTTGQCRDARAIAEAIPGARAMANTAFNWFLSFGTRDRARVALLLRANFLSDADNVRDTVEDRILSISNRLSSAQTGNITFDCAPVGDPECPGRQGYVMTNERDRIHICDSFFNLSLEARRWMLVHECAHLAGAMTLPESYYAMFGPIGEDQCRDLTPSSSTTEALGNADNYARLVWCLTKPPGSETTPVPP